MAKSSNSSATAKAATHASTSEDGGGGGVGWSHWGVGTKGFGGCFLILEMVTI